MIAVRGEDHDIVVVGFEHSIQLCFQNVVVCEFVIEARSLLDVIYFGEVGLHVQGDLFETIIDVQDQEDVHEIEHRRDGAHRDAGALCESEAMKHTRWLKHVVP